VELGRIIGKRLSGIILGAVSISERIPIIGSPWNMLTDSMTVKILRLSDDRNIKADKNVIRRFRKDTNRFFDYMPKKKPITFECRVSLIFGSEDPFTADRKKLADKLKKYIHNDFDIYEIEGAKHFFTHTHISETANIINEITENIFERGDA
jgi:pimeloyl-ACP methyl ester carboxylesterase